MESSLEKATNLQDAVDTALNRQQLDGLLNMSAIAEIRYVCSLWIKMLSLISSYNIGCAFVKEELIRILLEQFSLKQIDMLETLYFWGMYKVIFFSCLDLYLFNEECLFDCIYSIWLNYMYKKVTLFVFLTHLCLACLHGSALLCPDLPTGSGEWTINFFFGCWVVYALYSFSY